MAADEDADEFTFPDVPGTEDASIMGRDAHSKTAGREPRDAGGQQVSVSGAPGTQVGSGNLQVNYFYGDLKKPATNVTPPNPTSGSAGALPQGHVFISYVREDTDEVDALQQLLEGAGVPVWRDTSSLRPGEDWGAKIREAITNDALVFIACFSSHSVARPKTYMNEELSLAISQLRQRQPKDLWLIPVRLDDCKVPDLDLGMGRTLASIQRADLFGANRDIAAERLVSVIRRLLGQPSSQPPKGESVQQTPSAADPAMLLPRTITPIPVLQPSKAAAFLSEERNDRKHSVKRSSEAAHEHWRLLLVMLMVLTMTVGAIIFILPSGPANGRMVQLWTIDASAKSAATNEYVGSWTSGHLLIVGFEDSITSYSLDSGTTMWTWTPPVGQQICEMSNTADYGIGIVAYAPQSNQVDSWRCQEITAISLSNGRTAWANPATLVPKGSWNKGNGEGIVMEGSTIAVMDGHDDIDAYNLKTGGEIWSTYSSDPNMGLSFCNGRQLNFNYTNITGSSHAIYVEFACTGNGGTPFRIFILGFSLGSGSPIMNVTLTGECKTSGVDGLWYLSDEIVSDCTAGTTSAKMNSFEIIHSSNPQISVNFLSDGTDDLSSGGNMTGQLASGYFAVGGSTLYLEGASPSGENSVIAIDLETGARLWTKPLPAGDGLTFIDADANGVVATIYNSGTSSQEPQIATVSYGSATGKEEVIAELSSPAVTASALSTFLRNGSDLIDVNGSGSPSTSVITVYSQAFPDNN